MPLYKEWNSDAYSLAAIWKIEEPEAFFTSATGMTADIKNEKRRLERLAGRYLLKHLKEDFPLLNIKPDEHDKPRIDDNQYYFSISHSWPYVAAVISPVVEAGIDIQCWHPNIERIQHKFLSAEEQAQFTYGSRELITLAWCAKEAVYKWQGRRGVEFIDHMPITKMEQISAQYNINIFCHLTIEKMTCALKGFTEADFACSYVVHSRIIHPY
jgi:phosphopantetheinyl transferase